MVSYLQRIPLCPHLSAQVKEPQTGPLVPSLHSSNREYTDMPVIPAAKTVAPVLWHREASPSYQTGPKGGPANRLFVPKAVSMVLLWGHSS